MLKLWLVTDLHFDGYDEGQPVTQSAAIFDATLEAFLADPACEILLIAGDLTNGSARDHAGLIPRLRRMQAAGKRVYVIYATHDYAHEDGFSFTKACPDDGGNPLDRPDGQVYRSDLRGLYNAFGFEEALSEYGGSSYCAQLAPGVRLLALNDDGDGREFCGFYEEQMRWAETQLTQAKEDGQLVLAMTHHPSQPPSPIYPIISKKDMLGNYEENTRRLADAGLRVMFTGHSHMHNISRLSTPAGSDYWDVNTGALGSFPSLYRVLTLEGSTLHVETLRTPDILWGPTGRLLREQFAADFDFMLRDLIESADKNYDRFAHSLGGMTVSPAQAYKLKLPLHLAGKLLNRVTLGGLGALLFCRRKVPKAVRKDSFKELFLELVRNIFSGEEKYGPDTPQGKALLAFAKQLNLPLRKIVRGLGGKDAPSFLGSLIYDPLPDDAAEISLL